MRIEHQIRERPFAACDSPRTRKVVGVKRRAHAFLGKRERPLHQRHGVEADLRGEARSLADAREVPRDAKAGEVGHGVGFAEDFRGKPLRLEHLRIGRHHIRPRRSARHLGGHQDARADRLGQDQRSTSLAAAEGDRCLVAQAGEREADGQLVAHRRMPANNRRARAGDHLVRRPHDLAHGALLQGGRHARQDDVDGRRLRLCPHRPDIAQRMDRGDAGHQGVIVGQAAQVVGGDHLLRAAGGQKCCIIARQGRDILARGRG